MSLEQPDQIHNSKRHPKVSKMGLAAATTIKLLSLKSVAFLDHNTWPNGVLQTISSAAKFSHGPVLAEAQTALYLPGSLIIILEFS